MYWCLVLMSGIDVLMSGIDEWMSGIAVLMSDIDRSILEMQRGGVGTLLST